MFLLSFKMRSVGMDSVISMNRQRLVALDGDLFCRFYFIMLADDKHMMCSSKDCGWIPQNETTKLNILVDLKSFLTVNRIC